MVHELKIIPKYFWAIQSGEKSFEIRKNDRNFQKYDTIIFKEWDGKEYTGNECERSVGYVYRGDGSCGLEDGYVVLGLKRGRPSVVLDGASGKPKVL